MKRVHRKHSADFKSKVAIEALKEQKTLAQISEQYTLHANQISDWKKVLFRLAWCSPRSSRSPRLVFSPSANGGVSGAS